jgi:hypothetical protein
MSSQGRAAPAPSASSILSPAVDFLLVGGLSLIVFVPLLLSGRTDLVWIGAGAQAWIATLINMPHFMASYRIVYRSREMILRHKWATIYIPAIMLVYTVLALWEAQYSPVLVIVFVSVSSAYLAWHYTGQVWGMMASYAYLGGSSFDKSERRLVRTSLRILLVWQVTWFLYTQLRDPSVVRPFYYLISAGTAAAFIVGVIGLAKMRKRTGKLPPARALVAWLALFVWYAMIARDPKAIFWIQIAHALQYLAFPIRVEMNRMVAAERSEKSPGARGGRFVLHMVLYGVGLLVVSLVVAQVVPLSAMGAVGRMFGEEPGKAAPILILMFINVHHYFTDGVIWKISNPEVRKELFAHVQPETRGRAAVPAVEARLGAGKARTTVGGARR